MIHETAGSDFGYAESAFAESAFFDTNILIYSSLDADPAFAVIAKKLLRRGGSISVQVLNEYWNVATKKLKVQRDIVQSAMDDLQKLLDAPYAITVSTHRTAVRLSMQYKYSIYDSLILASAFEAGCNVLYTEDMQDGQRIEGLTIRNPFRSITTKN